MPVRMKWNRTRNSKRLEDLPIGGAKGARRFEQIGVEVADSRDGVDENRKERRHEHDEDFDFAPVPNQMIRGTIAMRGGIESVQKGIEQQANAAYQPTWPRITPVTMASVRPRAKFCR